jgi:SAM-dependent methyltransferase
MGLVTACRSCHQSDLQPIVSLGRLPLANALVSREDTVRVDERYPLDLALCRRCSLVQITETVAPARLFHEYLYFSSYSDTMVRHARDLAQELCRARRLDSSSCVIEIGSNDGYLLQHFLAAGVRVLGVEPARNVAAVAEARGIATISEFFGSDLAAKLAAAGEAADVIVANNVMAHVPDINGIVQGIKRLLKPHGVFVMETPYVKDLLDTAAFDTIYHEHLFYYSLSALEALFRRNELAIAAVQHVPIHGGSLRVTAVHAGEEGQRPGVTRLLDEERRWGVAEPIEYQRFAAQVAHLQRSLAALLRQLRAQGKRLCAYGAAAKATTLLNVLGVGVDVLEFVVDRSEHKQGRYIPGVRIPIKPVAALLDEQPDYVLLLAWNLAAEIMEQQRTYQDRGGAFIIPLPTLTVVSGRAGSVPQHPLSEPAPLR